MTAQPGAEAFLPDSRSLPNLRTVARECQGCDLYQDAEQTVFGAGNADAVSMFVGEQPGDQEDRGGEPFVGPAGRLLDRALEEAGIDCELTYVTHAVKHFKFTRAERGKRRIHKEARPHRDRRLPSLLTAELHAVDPDVVVCLGATPRPRRHCWDVAGYVLAPRQPSQIRDQLGRGQ